MIRDNFAEIFVQFSNGSTKCYARFFILIL
jgi:hypothetical protein